MKTFVTAGLTARYLQKLGQYNYIAVAVALLIICFGLFWMLFRIGGDEITATVANSIFVLVALLSAFYCLLTAHRARYGKLRLEWQYQLAWFLCGLGLLANAIGGIYFTFQEALFQHVPFPSPSDIFFTLYSLLILLGILFFPTTLRLRTRIALDTLISSICIFGMCWFFFLGALCLAALGSNPSVEATFGMVVSLSYLAWDLLLIFAVVLLIQRNIDPVIRSSLIFIGLGVLCSTLADFIFGYFDSMSSYKTGTAYIDTLWLLDDTLVGLAALQQYTAIARNVYKKQQQQRDISKPLDLIPSHIQQQLVGSWQIVQSLVVNIPLAILLTLVVYGVLTHDHITSPLLVILAVITAVLIAARFYLANQENRELLSERERRRQVSELLRHIATELTEILDIEQLRERVVSVVTKKLGFDAAILLFVEEQDHPLDPEPHLLVNAHSKSAGPVLWHFRGDNLLYRTYLQGEEQELNLEEHEALLPDAMHIWRSPHGYTTMLFIPLLYHGKIVGSLGVSRIQTSFNVNPIYCDRDLSMLRAYAEQVATILEHAYLYQAAREREAFAKAMVNIATRLNAAVVDPAEISQLICEEGANVLRADYTLLYVSQTDGSLRPLAAFIGDELTTPTVSDWPLIQPQEYEAHSLNSLQPMLLYVTDSISGRIPHPTRLTPLPALPPPRSQNGQTPITAKQYTYSWQTSPHQAPGKQLVHRPAASRLLPAVLPPRRPVRSLRDKLATLGVRTAILAPLMAEGRPIALLVFARSHTPGAQSRGPFDVSDLPQAQDFVEQAGVAFTNANLYLSLRTAHHQLQELDYMKDQFMITASHELRTPLTAIQGYIELMAQFDEVLETEQRRDFIEKAQRGCDELVLLLGNVMDASQVGAGVSVTIKPVIVREVIDKVILLIEPNLTQEQREVHLSIPPHLSVYADPMRLRQILMNVSVNALKYSPAGTPIMFAATPIVKPGDPPSVIISVTDRGQGISPQDQRRLFQRFVRLERDMNSPVRGSGLGLYISRRLVEAMKGRIWIESRGIPGQGSTLHIQLPMMY